MNLTSFVWFRMESGHWPTVCTMDDVQPILDGHVFPLSGRSAPSGQQVQRFLEDYRALSASLRSVMSTNMERLIAKLPSASLIALAFNNTDRLVPSLRAISSLRLRIQASSLKRA